MRASFISSLIAIANSKRPAPLENEPSTGTDRWAHLQVSMDQYDTYTFKNQIDHFDEKDERTYNQRYWVNNISPRGGGSILAKEPSLLLKEAPNCNV